MTLLLGAMLAAGLLLTAAPWLWPAGTRTARDPSRGRLVRLMEEAGYASVPPRTVRAVVVSAAVLSASLAWLLTQLPALAVLAALVAGWAPIAYLRGRRLRLRRQRRQLWADVCDLLVASSRVGMSLPDAVSSLAASAPPMLRPAFAAFARDMHAAGRFEHALDLLKPALADPVADRIIETLRMARQVGGTELTTVLRALSQSVRTEALLRAEVEARQTWIRGAAVLGVVAPWVILGLLVTRPEGAAAYATPAGFAVIVTGAAVSVIAFRLMVRIGRLPEPRRWFA